MLYTRKGDKGTTRLFSSPERVCKTAPIVEALGAVDELNAWLGMARALSHGDREVHDALLALQEDLFVIEARLAGAPKRLAPERLVALEAMIAAIEREIPPITTFTIPGEATVAASLDVARTVARRAERAVCALEMIPEGILPYLNRLSSILFALARLSAHRARVKERAPSY